MPQGLTLGIPSVCLVLCCLSELGVYQFQLSAERLVGGLGLGRADVSGQPKVSLLYRVQMSLFHAFAAHFLWR